MKLSDKVCIVTGASRGIGKAVAIGFAREGANLVIAARTEIQKDTRLPGTIHETAEQIRSLGRKALAVKTDVRHEADVEAMVSQAIEAFGRVDILVHNAALAFWGKVVDTPPKIWDSVVEANLKAAFLCAKNVLPYMIKQKSGSIINYSSPVAEIGTPPVTGLAYAASKAGVERFSNGLAEEVKEYGIAVNCLKPARPVATEGLKFWGDKVDSSTWVTPEAMVKATIFLAIQTASGITGGIFTDEALVQKYHL